MEAPLTLRRPANWQDFETLCKKLWGEIWNCPETKKNGRTGQEQQGVDVYGIPFGEDRYYGVQCKGKDEYTHKQFTKAEIIEEIEKAQKFQPALKKLYFATTAVKDAGIEEFIRTKNLENITKGLFEIHIFAWEDIVDLIDENRQTHDWYVKSQNFKSNKNVKITFQDGLTELVLNPKYKKTITNYKQKIVPELPYGDPLNFFYRQQQNLYATPLILSAPSYVTKVNFSYCKLYFQVHNIGLDPIEEFKLFFNFEGEVVDLKDTNIEHNRLSIIAPFISDVTLWRDNMSGKVNPKRTILVGDDSFSSDDFFIKTAPKEYEILVNWKLVSKDLKDDGTLKIVVKPDFEIMHDDVLVEDPLKANKIVEGDFEDVIIDED
ncbi:hypothetical protein [Sphingobacterium psychroaquaticum]|uniref:Restriction endonuclease n=1 Tax=Sphingobacterium psychroaquaticum TaxID=561061 RepID=A0A1X7KDF2_9SPHI|nr:hypothetical protein [Sphingobacterium psychroaquaticum]SMG39263.1 hypothetical protein SAMN05660862_2761 [Sphingobacterium psychroaquaticum]